MTRIADLPTFDMAEQLRDAEDIAAYLQLALDDEDPAELAHPPGQILSHGTPSPSRSSLRNPHCCR